MKKAFPAAVLLSLSLLSACITLTGPRRELHTADLLFNEKRYGEAITAYGQVLKDYPNSSCAADARFSLAYTLAFYDNPQRDYSRALHEFDEFIKAYPADERVQEAQNWCHIIKTLSDTKKDNERLNKSIEDLKRLDIKQEEKRKKRQRKADTGS